MVDRKIPGRRSTIYYKALDHERSLSDNIRDTFESIYQDQGQSFKTIVSLSFVLQHRETDEYRFYYACRNNRLLSLPRLIRNREDLEQLIEDLLTRNLEQDIYNERPNSKWQIEKITNLCVDVIPTDYPLGEASGLPDYVKNNPHIIAFENNEHTGLPYNDHLCLFRCLAIGKYGSTRHNCDTITVQLKDLYRQKMNIRHFHGVTLEEIPLVEQIFECQIHIMQLKENGTVETVYQASSKHPIKIYLNLCGEHLSLITDHLPYAKEFVCKRCGKVLSEMTNLQHHERRCDGTVKYKYPGDVYTNTPSIFEELESNGIIVADELKFEKYFAIFDFEAYQ